MGLFRFLQADPKYKLRHLILEYLYKRTEERMSRIINPAHKIDLDKSNVSYEDVCSGLGVTEDEFYKAHVAMHYAEHNQLLCTTKEREAYVGLLEPGLAAYMDEYWLKQGRKELNERLYDKTKWIIPFLALIATVGSIVYSATKVQGMQEKIDKLQSAIETQQQKQSYQNRNVEVPKTAQGDSAYRVTVDTSKNNTTKK